MTAKRTLLALAFAGVLVGQATAQTPVFGSSPVSTPSANGGSAPTPLFGGRPASASTRNPIQVVQSTSAEPALPLIPPVAGGGSTSTLPPIPGSDTSAPAPGTIPTLPTLSTATDVLTGQPGTRPMVPGAAYSPWMGENTSYLGTGHGPITYEGYARTGVALNIGGGELSAILKTGWMTAGGGRTLFFNETNDAAWVLDLGLSFTNNYGQELNRTTQVSANAVKGSNPANNFTIPLGIYSVRRTSLNFGIGRDWWLYGPGTVSETPNPSNWRYGFDVGGRWGTSSIDFDPQFDPGGLMHRQSVYHGVYLGGSLNWEKQLGIAIFQAGVRAEWGYDWLNLIPPQSSDLQNINILLTCGLRY